MLKKLVCASLLVLAGCFHPFSTEPSITYHADKSFSPTERQCIKDSADQWRTQTSGAADIAVDYDYNSASIEDVLSRKLDDKLIRWTSGTPEVREMDAAMQEDSGDPNQLLLGLTSGNTAVLIRKPITIRLVMDRLQDPNACRLAAIHEFGHAFGLRHEPGVTNIMFPAVDNRRTACLKHDDLMQFSAVNNVPFELMKPCPDQDPEVFGFLVPGSDK